MSRPNTFDQYLLLLGNGPFPAVIDMFGDEGGLIEFRSSLLATHGFAALSLPYFNFEDLPKVMDDFRLEYFEEAARFLLRHPKVSDVNKTSLCTETIISPQWILNKKIMRKL